MLAINSPMKSSAQVASDFASKVRWRRASIPADAKAPAHCASTRWEIRIYSWAGSILSSTHHIDGQDSPTGRGEAEQPQDGLSHGPSGETGLEVLKSAADELSQCSFLCAGKAVPSVNPSKLPRPRPAATIKSRI